MEKILFNSFNLYQYEHRGSASNLLRTTGLVVYRNGKFIKKGSQFSAVFYHLFLRGGWVLVGITSAGR